MKALIFATVCFSVLTMACEKPSPPPPPPPTTFSLAVTVIGKGSADPDKVTGIQAGSSVVLSLRADDGHKLYSVKVDGVNIGVSICSETKLTIPQFYSNKNAVIKFIEEDITWVSTLRNPAPWMLKAIELYGDKDNFLGSLELTPTQVSNKYYFYYSESELKYQFLDSLDNSRGNGTWSLSNGTFQIALTVFQLKEAKDTVMVYAGSKKLDSDGVIRYPKYTYKRQKSQ